MTQSFDDVDVRGCTFNQMSTDYHIGFESGSQSRQGEVNRLQGEIDELKKRIDVCEILRDSQFEKLWGLTQAIEVARNGADEDFDLFLNYLSNILKGKENETRFD